MLFVVLSQITLFITSVNMFGTMIIEIARKKLSNWNKLDRRNLILSLSENSSKHTLTFSNKHERTGIKIYSLELKTTVAIDVVS